LTSARTHADGSLPTYKEHAKRGNLWKRLVLGLFISAVLAEGPATVQIAIKVDVLMPLLAALYVEPTVKGMRRLVEETNDAHIGPAGQPPPAKPKVQQSFRFSSSDC
jgi:hypothetical protein